MATWRILKEKTVPRKQRTDDLSSWTKFVATNMTFEGDRDEIDAHLAALQAKSGGCYSAEEIQAE
ncbi:MAG: hypothetical protein E5X53_26375 [Mesorhizobium sp.]|uniref:hypothetical protein n=1 Tax=Mesorhizobium sp. TaxID=1871066 RepID=UPI0012107D90|nr:hypothetical protein [Mesorhizobium sp.]TIP70591.1 MAG: hypothetical protein E5X55_26625 [Mesorhizobium sp.]TIQ05330.1 MAG: hypothetical protein E5X57_28415 [Mesorhizobium sp.]TIR49025.1 MAG: hypothetical protein E5X53_26375 [Mesorhizobium sp.]TJV94860.1 MAG: hypothetical protein E5X52_26900 [Mesorhizobium sp.]